MQDTDSYICTSNEKGENSDQKAPEEALGSGSALFAKYLMTHVCKILYNTCIVYLNSFFSYPFIYQYLCEQYNLKDI